MQLFINQMSLEFLQQIRQPRQVLNGCLFFLMVVVFFPLTMSSEKALLQKIAPGLIWISMLLALFLSSERLFQEDYDEGVIEQWLVSLHPIWVRVMAKVLVHWIFILLPMLILSPFLAILFSLNFYELKVLDISMILGTPGILFLCALAAAFATGLQSRGTLMALILFPLTLPMVMFGSATLSASMAGFEVLGYLALLSAMSLVCLTILPFAVSAVIRIGLVD